MMSTMLTEMISSQTQCDRLKNLFEGRNASLDWLVIADDDPVLNQRITEVTNEEEAVVMPIAQEEWRMQSDDLPSAVRWSVGEAGVSNLLVVGSSNAQVQTLEAGWIGGLCETPASRSNYDRLLEGTRRVHGQTQVAKTHFAKQVNQLCGDETLRKAVRDSKVQLYLLFYIAMSGAFLSYDLATNRFKPIK